MAEMRFTILGCGSSGGVPRLGGIWGDCDPENPKNRRRRCSLLVERETDDGVTRLLVDTSPDLREQLLDAGIGELNAVLFTHPHADHTHGVDDLRMIVFNMRERLSVWADAPTQKDLLSRFGYAFEQPEGSAYPAILNLHGIDGAIDVDGPGGKINAVPFKVKHGNIDSLGFRFGGLAYLPDASELYDESRAALEDLDYWIVDALRRDPHPSHSHYEKTLGWIDELAPKNAILTNMHIDLDYETVLRETAPHISPAHDGLVIRFEV